MPKPVPFLWFNGRLEEAVTFYASVFPDSKVHHARALSRRIARRYRRARS